MAEDRRQEFTSLRVEHGIRKQHAQVNDGQGQFLTASCKLLGDAVVAEHARLWGKEEVAYDATHYLELLERKPGALDYAEPLAEWELPTCFHLLRGRLEEQGRVQGIKEYIRVLRLQEKHPLHRVTHAIEKALKLRHCSRDIVAQYLYPDEAPAAPTFVLDGREHLQGIRVDTPDLGAYAALLEGRTLLGGLN